MRSITVTGLADTSDDATILIEGLEGGLYMACALLDGKRLRIISDSGEALKARSLSQMQELLRPVPFSSALLDLQSAHEEMIGLDVAASNGAAMPLHWSASPDT